MARLLAEGRPTGAIHALPEPAGPPWSTHPPTRSLRVLLINMPWARADSPSIQCGLLQAITRQCGHECDVRYLNLELAAQLGHRLYDGLADTYVDHQLGEWLFSFAAFGEVTTDHAYLDEFPSARTFWSQLGGGGTAELCAFRRHRLPEWLDQCLEGTAWARYDVAGFSSTFLQNTASLALGRRLKQRFPDLTLVYGGANLDGDMGLEYLRKLDWIDYVVTGEGDIAFPHLLSSLANGVADPKIPGVHRRGSEPASVAADAVRTQDLDALPIPDYTDYFRTLGQLGQETVTGRTHIKLPVELSRGCWWGEKHHCTFCGINALAMPFRAKSDQRALAELAELLEEYPAVHLEAVDNILDMRYFTSLCTELAERRWDVSIFYEVKANLRPEHLRLLARAGINWIQPGIESLSTHVLQLMRKGSSKLINLRLLKWARYFGLVVEWNILGGFPGETDADYHEQAALVPLLHHLEPPAGGERFWLERFSPYFTDSSFPIHGIRPQSSYRHIYPDSLQHDKIAYSFEYEADHIATAGARRALDLAIEQWRHRWAADRRPSLTYQRLPETLRIIDRRSELPQQTTLTGWRAEAYQACDYTSRSPERIREQLASLGYQVTAEQVRGLLEACCRAGVMASEDEQYLGLALPENPGW